MRLPVPVPSAASKGQQPASSGERSIMDLRKLIADFLTKIEGALHTPYDLTKAQKDYESIAMALAIIEKGMEDRDMLNVCDSDLVKSPKQGGPSLDELLQRAVLRKTTVDSEFQKIATAASSAQSRGET